MTTLSVARPVSRTVARSVVVGDGLPEGVLTPDLYSYDLDETAGVRLDSSSNHYNLSDNNDVASATGQGGTGTAADFAELSDCFLDGEATDINGGVFSFIGWVYVNPGFDSVGYYWSIGELGAIGAAGNFAARAWVEGNGSGTHIEDFFIDVTDGTTLSRARFTPNLSFSTFHFVYAGYDGTNAFIQVNGTNGTNGAANNGPRALTTPTLVLGHAHAVTAGVQDLDGRLQGFRGYSRLLTSAELTYASAQYRSDLDLRTYTP